VPEPIAGFIISRAGAGVKRQQRFFLFIIQDLKGNESSAPIRVDKVNPSTMLLLYM